MEKYRMFGILGGLTFIFEFVMNVIASRLSNENYIIILEVFATIIFIFLIYVIFIKLLNRKRRQSWIEYKDASQYKALIAAVSPQKDITPAEIAIKHHLPKLTHCWLLVTEQAKDNFNMIEEKYQRKPQDSERYIGDDGHEIIFERESLINPDDIKEVFNIVKNIYHDAKSRGFREKEIIADYTGGTSSVTAGMILVTALSENRNLEFLKPKVKGENGRPIISEGFNPVDIDLKMPGE